MKWRYHLAWGTAIAVVVAGGASSVPAHAEPAPLPSGAAQAVATPPEPQVTTSAVEPAKRNEVLGAGWQRSGDRMWATASDGR